MRSNHSLFQIGPFTNRVLNRAALISIALIAVVVFIPPVAVIFGLASLSANMYVAATLLAFVPIPVLEVAKGIGLIRARHSNK